jgi:hypothetical protein
MRNVIPRPKAGGDIFTPGLFFTKPEAGMTSKIDDGGAPALGGKRFRFMKDGLGQKEKLFTGG